MRWSKIGASRKIACSYVLARDVLDAYTKSITMKSDKHSPKTLQKRASLMKYKIGNVEMDGDALQSGSADIKLRRRSEGFVILIDGAEPRKAFHYFQVVNRPLLCRAGIRE